MSSNIKVVTLKALLRIIVFSVSTCQKLIICFTDKADQGHGLWRGCPGCCISSHSSLRLPVIFMLNNFFLLLALYTENISFCSISKPQHSQSEELLTLRHTVISLPGIDVNLGLEARL